MRILAGIPFVLALGGCVAAIPPALTIASYAADGVSLLVSGKSVSDHAISQIANEDCAMWRLLKLENPCRDYLEDVDDAPSVEVAQGGSVRGPAQAVWSDPGPEQEIASVERIETNAFRGTIIEVTELAPPTVVEPVESLTFGAEPRSQPFEPLPSTTSEFPVAGIPNVQTAKAVAAVAPSAGRADMRYVVFGSFTRKSRAQCLADAHAHIDAAVVSADVRGKTYYRVVSGGRRLTEAQALRDRFAATGFEGPWLARGCGDGPAGGSCVAVEQWAEVVGADADCPDAQMVLQPKPAEQALRPADGVLAGG